MSEMATPARSRMTTEYEAIAERLRAARDAPDKAVEMLAYIDLVAEAVAFMATAKHREVLIKCGINPYEREAEEATTRPATGA